jgi:exodeoxyribonuclease VII small subunit
MPSSQINFEKLLKELEEIAEDFESGNLSLEEGLKKFERGLFLAAQAKKRLKEIKNKVELIKKKFAEDFSEELPPETKLE